MKFSILFSGLFFFLVILANSQTLADISVKDINGVELSLSSYQGKKLMFIELSSGKSDSIVIQLDQFLTKHAGLIEVIGIISLNNGYTDAEKQLMIKKYGKKGIVLTEPIHTGNNGKKDVLIQWLTEKDKNGKFGFQSRGAGQKYFVSASGKLVAVLPPQAELSLPMIDRLITGKSLQ